LFLAAEPPDLAVEEHQPFRACHTNPLVYTY
jgi:hypothetical protein